MNINNRSSRHEALVQLLQSQRFSSQQNVAEALERLGFDVTQASISRDFQELGVSKIGGRYIAEESRTGQKELEQLILSAEAASAFLFVIKTPPGGANVIAAKIDRMNIPAVAGTIAGDDTIFIATKNKAAQARLRALFALSKHSPDRAS